MGLVRNTFITGNIAGAVTIAVALLCSRRNVLRPAAPINAVSHIWTGHGALRHGYAPTRRNAVIGSLLHQGAAVFWATFFEPLFGKRAERSTASAIVGGMSVAATAYVTDYHLVAARFKPGYEVALSNRSLSLLYAALGATFAACARLRGLRHHQVKDRHERDEGRHAEHRPDAVVPPVAVR